MSTSQDNYIIFLDAQKDLIDQLIPVLQKEGYIPISAKNPEDALRMCHKYRPKVLVPNVSNPWSRNQFVEFITSFRKSATDSIGIVLLTKDSAPECKELKGIRYVREPYLSNDLVCAIKEAEEILLLKEERNMFLEQVTEYAMGLEKMVQEQTSGLTAANERLRELSITDDLTGVYNRRYFFERFDEEINQSGRYGHPLSVMILDLDNFKSINDCMGHMAGDDVLREFAAILKKKLRKGETVARYGGEEFAVILPHITVGEALKAAESLRKKVEASKFSCTPEGIAVTVSIGVAELDREIRDPDELIARADRALYEAKRQGKNRTSIWPPQQKN